MMLADCDAEAFEENYRDAFGYHRRAEQFVREGKRHSLVFNVGAVALERYLVAMCHLYGAMPLNHNYICLMNAVETVVAFPAELNREIRSLDFIFGICSLENYFHGTPEPADAERVLLMCQAVRELFDQDQIAALRKEAGGPDAAALFTA
ncbi:hypothetical protein D3C73_837880 [compost metagenome]